MFGKGWEFLFRKISWREYLVRARWGVMSIDKEKKPKVTPTNVARLEIVRAYAKALPNNVFSEALLIKANIRRYLVPLLHTLNDNCTIPMWRFQCGGLHIKVRSNLRACL